MTDVLDVRLREGAWRYHDESAAVPTIDHRTPNVERSYRQAHSVARFTFGAPSRAAASAYVTWHIGRERSLGGRERSLGPGRTLLERLGRNRFQAMRQPSEILVRPRGEQDDALQV